MTKSKITIAIQSNGRLKGPSLAYLATLGINLPQTTGRNLTANCNNTGANVIFVRHRDIPLYVRQGLADFGIVGKNIIVESGESPLVYQTLNFGLCSLVLAVPKNSPIQSPKDLSGLRIATSYPKSLKDFLDQNKIEAEIIELRGSVEVAPLTGLADAICDITQTGSTLKANKLRIIEKVYDSTAVCIVNPKLGQIKFNQSSAKLTKNYANILLQLAVQN